MKGGFGIFFKRKSFDTRLRELDERLSRACADLEDKLRAITRELDNRDLHWDEMRARCKRLLDRTEKYAQSDARRDGATIEGSGDRDSAPVALPPTSIATSPDRMSRLTPPLGQPRTSW